MKETVDSKKVVGSFVGRYIALIVIIGAIALFLENVIPNLAKWDLSAQTLVFQTVVSVIATLLTIILSVKHAMKDVKLTNKEDAKKISKPIQTILIIVALIVMTLNLVYFIQIRASKLNDIDAKYTSSVMTTEDENYKTIEENNVYAIYGFYLAAREIITILVYSYAVVYVEMMIENDVMGKKTTTKKSKKEVEANA